ncbi:MAG: hypothetical protein ACKVS6_12500 [Planctomycetota bacterium]
MTTSAPSDPKLVIREFIEATRRRDSQAMRNCMSKKTLESGEFHEDGPEIASYEISNPIEDQGETIVPTSLVAKNPPPGLPGMPNQPGTIVMPFVVIRESGGWKIDMGRSTDRLFGGGIDKLFAQMADTMQSVMKGAMEGVTNAMAAGLEEAFGTNKTGTNKADKNITSYNPTEEKPKRSRAKPTKKKK